MANRPVILSIAGFDPSSGAGVTADVKTAAAFGCYAVTCITALTVQSTQGVFAVEPVKPEVVRETLHRLADDVDFAGVRVGMLGTRQIAEVVTDFFREYKPKNRVLDPVLWSSSGAKLLSDDGISYIQNQLLPVVDAVTPNVEEASALGGEVWLGARASWEKMRPLVRSLAGMLLKRGCRAVVITGGNLEEANDLLAIQEGDAIAEYVFRGERIETRATHGTGCAFAMALTCLLATGRELPAAVGEAKEYVRRAMLAAYPVGKGTGPMNHLFRLK